MKVNVYDFDKTIYINDSAVDFVKYTLKKRPFLIIGTLIKSIPTCILFLFKIRSLKQLKESLMSFILKINNLKEYVEVYWNEKEKYIKKWYLNQKESADIIVSANFDFIIAPIAKRLGVEFIATKFNTKTAKVEGLQCRKENKIKMFYDKYPNYKMNKTYSDSKTDIPLLEEGIEGYVVKGETIEKYYKGYFN